MRITIIFSLVVLCGASASAQLLEAQIRTNLNGLPMFRGPSPYPTISVFQVADRFTMRGRAGVALDTFDLAQQGATSGQVLKWNGTAWAPAADGGDNWGTQTASTAARISGNGTSGSPLDLAQQGATSGQVLKWNGTAWAPAADGGDNWGTQTASTAARLSGNGTSGSPLDLAQQGASSGQVLKWNGTAWAPADDFGGTGGDNWGTQTASTAARLSGNGTSGSPLDLAQQGASSGQVLKWNGTAWAPAADGGDNWGSQTASTAARISGNGTSGSPLDLAQQGATSGQVLKWNGTAWAPAADSDAQTLSFTPESGTLSISNGNSLVLDTYYLRTTAAFGGDVTGTYNNLQIVAGAVGTNELAANAVTTAKIANGAVGGPQVANGSLTGADLAAETITDYNILDGSVLGGDIATDAIGPTQLASTGTATGTFGGHNKYVSLTVDADGRIESVSETAFSMPTYASTAPGDIFVWQPDDYVVVADPTLGSMQIELQGLELGRSYTLIGSANLTNSITIVGISGALKLSGDAGTTGSYPLSLGQHLEIIPGTGVFYVSKK